MAIYRLSSQVISRSKGRSAVAAAAYRAAESLVDDAIGRSHDYTKKQGVFHNEIMAPDNAPKWNREQLWNEATNAEKRKDSQLAREIQVAIPRELSKDDYIPLMQEFVQENFVDKGMIADLAIHIDNPDNPHAHILLTTRNVDESGFGAKNRDWNSKKVLNEWRMNWSKIANEYLISAGHDERIDHRSYADRGIDLVPASKIFDYQPNNDAFTIISPKLKYGDNEVKQVENVLKYLDEIAHYSKFKKEKNRLKQNLEIIKDDPSVLVRLLTENDAVVTDKTIEQYLTKLGALNKDIDAVKQKMIDDDLLVIIDQKTIINHDTSVPRKPRNDNSFLQRLGIKGKRRISKENVYTSKENLNYEIELVKSANSMASKSSRVITNSTIFNVAKNYSFSEEQKLVYDYANSSSNLIVINGVAGAGKSYIMEAVKETHKKSGYSVLGLSSTGSAAENLENSTGIKSSTIAAFNYNDIELKADNLVVIDEAGMASSAELAKVLKKADMAGAKVVLLGDTRQLSSVGAGRAFENIVNNIHTVDINVVRRQEKKAHKNATNHLANGNTSEALKIYHNESAIVHHENLEAAKEEILTAWLTEKRGQPDKTSMMLAFSRKNAQHLNLSAHETLKKYDMLGGNMQALETAKYGKLEFAEGEQVVFTRNNKSLGVKNGTQGRITYLDKNKVIIKTDNKDITLSVKKEPMELNYNYAQTIHKSQGQTYDKSFVLLSRAMKRKATYVALTRHKKDIEIHWSFDQFNNGKDVSKVLGQVQDNKTALDVLSKQYQEKYQSNIIDNIFAKEKSKVIKEVEKMQIKPKRKADSSTDISIQP